MINQFASSRSSRLLLLTLAFCLLQNGCVRRRMTIRSNPEGAVAFVDDRHIGVTPVSTPFTYYGTRKIQLFKDGFEPLTVKQRFGVPWYELPPLDFIAENLWPGEIRDERVVNFEMIPQQVVPNEQLLERAELLRGNTQASLVTPLFNPPPAQQFPATTLQPPTDALPSPVVGSGVVLPPGR